MISQPSPVTTLDPSEVEREAIELFNAISAHTIHGDWLPSPVEERGRAVREALIRTPGTLRAFRRSFLASGRLNFPDSPRPKEHFLAWGDRLPTTLEYLRGAWHMLRMAVRLRMRVEFQLSDLDDNRVGMPSVYAVPASLRDGMQWLLHALVRSRRHAADRLVHLTEVRMRTYYYCRQIERFFGRRFGPVLEIGGGYGALAGEFVDYLETPVYFLVELPDAIPLAYFYLRIHLGRDVQVLHRAGDRVQPGARVVILPPWMLHELDLNMDLAINTMSFQHMNWLNLGFYFREIERLAIQRMYLVNRNARRDPSDVPIDAYPIPGELRLLTDGLYPFGPHRERFYGRPHA